MTGLLEYLFSAASFVPRGYCLLWRPDLVALHAIADFLIASAYFSIPAAIFVFVYRRPDLEFKGIAHLFSAFILLCGTTHLLGLGTLWFPYYGFEGLIKAATAGVSVVTAIALWPLLPRVLALPSPRQLREANASLETETASACSPNKSCVT